jgi:hypothetical protein
MGYFSCLAYRKSAKRKVRSWKQELSRHLTKYTGQLMYYITDGESFPFGITNSVNKGRKYSMTVKNHIFAYIVRFEGYHYEYPIEHGTDVDVQQTCTDE